MGVPTPDTPLMTVVVHATQEVLTIAPGSLVPVRWWLVQRRIGDAWETHLFDAASHTFYLPPPAVPASPEIITVTAIGRAGGASAATALRVH
jgi:hypothetical protein